MSGPTSWDDYVASLAPAFRAAWGKRVTFVLHVGTENEIVSHEMPRFCAEQIPTEPAPGQVVKVSFNRNWRADMEPDIFVTTWTFDAERHAWLHTTDPKTE